jgi:hypothetical protein
MAVSVPIPACPTSMSQILVLEITTSKLGANSNITKIQIAAHKQGMES